MLYRTLGKTGLKVSQLGFGAMRLPMTGVGEGARVDDEKAVPLMHKAFAAGINYIDSAVFYCNRDSQRAVGAALKSWRGQRIYVSTKNDYKGLDEAAWHKNLQDSVRFLDMGSIDVYNIHGVSWQVYQEAVEPAIGKWLTRARDQGLIRHIAASCHDSPENMIKLIDTGFFESFTVQYNLLDRKYEPAIKHAHRKNTGIVVMGPLAGGRVVASSAFSSAIPGLSHVPELALRFVLANPNVTVALSGMEKADEIEHNARVASDGVPLSAEDYASIDAHLKRLRAAADLYCSGCGYCAECPQNVRIANVFRLYNMGRVYGNWTVARRDYTGICKNEWDPQGRDAAACNECGACEKKCPQKLPIRQQLKEAHQALAGK